MRHYFILSIAAIALVLPSFLHADVISSQTDHSTEIDTSFNLIWGIGTGLSGVYSTIEVWASNSIAVNGNATVACYTSDTYGTACPEQPSVTITGVPFTTDAGGATIVLDFSGTTTAARTLSPTRYYRINYSNGSSGTMHGYGISAPDTCLSGCVGTPYYIMYDDFGPVVDTTTRIIITEPYDGETIATSSSASLGATGYINSDDYESGTFLEIKYANFALYQSSAAASPDLLYTTLSIPITSSGSFNLTTTSPVTMIGKYSMVTSIKTPSITNNVLNFLGFGQFANLGILSATTTEFIGDRPSAYDNYVSSTTQSVDDYLASSTISLASCSSWTSFSLGDCLNLMFVPQTQPIYTALGNFKENFLTYFPWGYLTRFTVILSGTATTSLPTFTATIPISPDENMEIITMDMNDMIRGGGAAINSIEDPFTGNNIQDILQPIFRIFVALSLLFIIVSDISGIGSHTDGRRRT